VGRGRRPEATLRPDLTFHDGEPLTADDVASPTGSSATPRTVSATRRRRPCAIAAGRRWSNQPPRPTAARSDLAFDEETDSVAERALTVPVLPRHVGMERTGEPQVGGLDMGGGTTEALVTANVLPVGKGRSRSPARRATIGSS